MPFALTYLLRLLLWSGSLLALLLTTGLLSGGGSSLVEALPGWGYQALVLGAFPAGIGSAPAVFRGGRLTVRGLGSVAGCATLIGIVVFGLAHWAAPAARQGGGDEPRALSLPALSSQAHAAVDRARDTDLATDWTKANTLFWEMDRRTSESLLVPLLTLLGLAVGFWSARVRTRGLELLQNWGMGVFLLLTLYGSVENGYELVAMRTVGALTPSGFLPLVVPGLLLLGLGWATLLAAWPSADA